MTTFLAIVIIACLIYIVYLKLMTRANKISQRVLAYIAFEKTNAITICQKLRLTPAQCAVRLQMFQDQGFIRSQLENHDGEVLPYYTITQSGRKFLSKLEAS